MRQGLYKTPKWFPKLAQDSLLNKILVVDPKKRIQSVNEIQATEWMQVNPACLAPIIRGCCMLPWDQASLRRLSSFDLLRGKLISFDSMMRWLSQASLRKMRDFI